MKPDRRLQGERQGRPVYLFIFLSLARSDSLFNNQQVNKEINITTTVLITNIKNWDKIVINRTENWIKIPTC